MGENFETLSLHPYTVHACHPFLGVLPVDQWRSVHDEFSYVTNNPATTFPFMDCPSTNAPPPPLSQVCRRFSVRFIVVLCSARADLVVWWSVTLLEATLCHLFWSSILKVSATNVIKCSSFTFSRSWRMNVPNFKISTGARKLLSVIGARKVLSSSYSSYSLSSLVLDVNLSK